ncbi:MAG: shikimate dehydrogenase [Reyranellaceae bacterium]
MADQDHYLMAGVMGHPVMHSRSPMLHNYWLEKHRLAGHYMPLAVRPEQIEKALRALPALGFAGCNLTMPHKETAVGIMDRVSPLVRKVGAMNCVVVAADGTLEGHNFEAFGYAESLAQEIPGWRADAGPIVLLGAGGGARAVVAGLAERGAREIRVINRSPARAEKLVRDLGSPAVALPWESRHDALADAVLVVNATSQGMHGQPPLDIDLAKLPASAAVSDLIYAPRETPFLAAARGRGNRAVNGLGMLLNQARPAFKAWFGVMPDVTPELRARIEATI